LVTVFDRVRKVTAAQLGMQEAEIKLSDNFAADLEADSLDMVEIMMALEDEFSVQGKKIAIPDEESEKMIAVKDAVEYLRSLGISDTEVPKTSEHNNQQTTNARKFGLPRPAFKRQGQPQVKNNAQQSQPQNRRPNTAPPQNRTNQPRRDNHPPS